MKTAEDIKNYVIENQSQGHICILNDGLFPDCINDGIYGFPHGGKRIGTKSYWRAIASLNNIGPKDLIFFHRTSGKNEGCKEIHGPFIIESFEKSSQIFYDKTDLYPIIIDGETNCTARFLFSPLESVFYSICNNYELIKKFETKRIWGLRHPSVMNIGAAQKKSIAAITVNQTLELIDLLYSPDYGMKRGDTDESPSETIQIYHDALVVNSASENSFLLNDHYLKSKIEEYSITVPDEAILYCYILRSLKFPNSMFRENLIEDFERANKKMLQINGGLTFESLMTNTILELVPSPHLQETVDIMLCDKEEKSILIMEIKKDTITQDAIDQSAKYVDLFEGIFPHKTILANIIGSTCESGVEIPEKLRDQIVIVKYLIEGGTIRFT